MPSRRVSSVFLALAAGACSQADPVEFCDWGDCQETTTTAPKIDFLFVIDSSETMTGEVSALSRALDDGFVESIRSRLGEWPSLHIGVVSSNLGAGGFDLPGCVDEGDAGRLNRCNDVNDPYLVDEPREDGRRRRNYQGELSDAFACLAQVPTTECAFAQHFEAMKRVLDGSNHGFLRSDSWLVVVLVADKDDCSAETRDLFDPDNIEAGPMGAFRCTRWGTICKGITLGGRVGTFDGCEARSSAYLRRPSEYSSFLRSLKSDRRVVVANITGPTSAVEVRRGDKGWELAPACNSTLGDAYPGIRLQSFVDQFPGAKRSFSICETAEWAGLEPLADMVGDALLH